MKIILDAGHALVTQGKRTPDGMKEFEFNNAVTTEMAKLLRQYKGVEIILAHDPTGKKDIPLGERVYTANKNKANLFISIHANAFGTDWNNANGIETFVYKKQYTEAFKLANAVHKKLISATGLLDRGVKEGDFQVLRATMMDSILVECGFMTNKKEAALLKSDSYRKQCSAAIVDAIAEYYKLKLAPKKDVVEVKPDDKQYRLVTGVFKNKAEAERVKKELEKMVKVVYLKEEKL